METALKVLEQNPIEVGKPKTFVRTVERLLLQIGLTVNTVGGAKSIESIASQCASLYNAGLYKLGDVCLRDAVNKYAKTNKKQFILVRDIKYPNKGVAP